MRKRNFPKISTGITLQKRNRKFNEIHGQKLLNNGRNHILN